MNLEDKSFWLSFGGTASCVLSNSVNMPVISMLLLIIGLVCVVLSISLFREDKEAKSSVVAVIIQNAERRTSQPELDQATGLAIIASCVILLVSFLNKSSWTYVCLIALGWIANGFAASMETNSLESVQTQRLYWTLPGTLLLVLGSLSFLLRSWGAGLVVATVGGCLFSIGNASIL